MRSQREVSIRFRLTLWYSAVLATGLILFALSTWLLLARTLRHELREELDSRTQSLLAFIDTERREPGVHLLEELVEYSHGLPDSTSFVLTAADGNLVFSSRPETASPDHNRAAPYLIEERRIRIDGKLYRLTGSISTHAVHSLLARLRVLLIILTPVVLGIASLGGFPLSSRALKPVDDITQAARTLSIADLSQRLRVPRTGDELQRLAETWNAMLERLEDAVRRLSRFTQDASHELRTPLAIIRSTAEIAARKTRSEEAYRTALWQIVQESDRLTDLVQNLLLLARDEQISKSALVPVDLGIVTASVVDPMRTLAQEKGIELVEEAAGSLHNILGDEAALRRLLIVLLDNAIRYSTSPGKVLVKLEAGEGRTILNVADSGIGIPEADLPKIFDRFYRSETARQSWANGAGLGLSLAAAIAGQHRAEIRVVSQPGLGARFSVLFPVA